MFDIENEVRIAGPEDFQEVFRLGCLLHKENGQADFSERRSREFLWRGCNRDNAIIGVIGPSDNIKAIIYLEIQQIYYSESMQLAECFAFVRPDSRKSDFAKKLVLFAKKCADETGQCLLIGIISDDRLAAKRRLYERHLPLGGFFYNYRPEREKMHMTLGPPEAGG